MADEGTGGNGVGGKVGSAEGSAVGGGNGGGNGGADGSGAAAGTAKVRRAQGPCLRLTAARRAALLERIAATCNVAASARVVGTTKASVYSLKGRDAAFAEQFSAAVQAGYERVEAELLAHTLADGGEWEEGEGGPVAVPAFNPDLALKVLQSRNAAQRERPRAGGASVKRASEREIEDALVAKLKGLARRLALIA